MAEWAQVSDDMGAADYGAVFAQEDKLGDKLYGVRVVEIVNMKETCGRDWNIAEQGGVYTASESYVDVDDTGWRKARSILDSMGWMSRIDHDQDYITAPARLRRMWLKRHLRELARLSAWDSRKLSEAEVQDRATCEDELETIQQWYSFTPANRAYAAHSYGGYEDDTEYANCVYKTLKEAMDTYGIPAGALWLPSEYDAPAEQDDTFGD